ncbi:recombinase family protein [Anaerotalea alkaliphila]|uniref:Recombinase family protein n=1 Tax=Anaerotalea alkaliphila TaxID=2662126 RepID=A0A7X5KPD0_9FIRM|nr:recombinase family protein [Anaerotalea alkaliphila]NDL67907.1 recombinase family protein [Anaerotalea alkaliphila]
MDQIDKSLWINKLWDPLEKIDDSPLHSKRQGIKVAAYCRVSLDSLGLSHSLESQVSHYTHVINSRDNWTFVGIYFDNLVTGRKASLRRGFTRMLRHCEEHRIDLILVKNVSRFSRNTKELIEVIERLKEINVAVFFEAENITSTRSETAYLLKTYASIAQGEIEAASQAIEWGHEKRMLKGMVNIGHTYGYDKTKVGNETVITINEEQAQVIRQIYQMYLDGMSINSIAVELTRKGIKTYFGKELWGSVTVRSILSNISYTGDVKARKMTKDLMSDKRRSSEGLRDQYFIENHHPAIISRELFDRVQEMRNKNKRQSKPQQFRPNPLSRRIHCGNCGQNFRRNRIKPWDYFRCVSAITNKNLCSSPTIREDLMVQIMLQAFRVRFDSQDSKLIKMLRRMLIRINKNDYFEFHRLKALTQIQLAKRLKDIQFTDEDIIQMERDYDKFENRLVEIEDDRKYRLDSIKWLENIKTFEEFAVQANIEYLRAWILSIDIYSKDDYKIYWIDGKETEVGSCEPIKPNREEYSAELNSKGELQVDKKAEFDVVTSIQITSKKGGDLNCVDEEDANMIAERKLEPNLMVKNIQKQLSNSVVMRTSIPVVREQKLKVAAYVRVSTELEQQKTSIKTQYSYYLYLILKDPRYTLADIYIDDGKSGRTTEGRPEFKRMMEDCKAGKVDLIITKSLSRFARNTVDTLTYLNMLKSLDPKVEVWFERENILSLSEKSNVLINLLSALGQEESVNIGDAIAWGKRSLAQRGIVRPTVQGYGYEYDKNKEWIINDEEAKIVRRIYDEYEKGKTMRAIRELLIAESIPTPGGQKAWCDTTIGRILRSEIYRGNYIYQRFHTGFTLVKERVENTGELPMYFIENHHKAIIEEEQWERVQKLVEANEKKRKKSHEKYPDDNGKNESFAKKFYCGKCGSLVGYSRAINRRRNNAEVRCWRCYQSSKGHCDSMQLKQDYIEENFSQLMMDIKFNLAFSEYIDTYIEDLRIKPEEEMQRAILEKQKDELNQKLYEAVEDELGRKGKDAKLVDHLTDEIMKIRERIVDFMAREEQQAEIEEVIKSIRKAMAIFTNDRKDDIDYYLKAPDFQAELFERFVEKGTILEDGQIIYRFQSGFEWKSPINYKAFQEQEKRRKKAKYQLEKKEFLKGPEVKALLKYCEEPKTITEMREYLPRYLTNPNFKKFIVNPLMRKGVIKETIPDKPTSRLQKYYSVKK